MQDTSGPPSVSANWRRVELWGCLAYSSNAAEVAQASRNKNLEIKSMNPLNNHRQSRSSGVVLALLLVSC